MKPPTGPPKTLLDRLRLKLAEFQCRRSGHVWQSVSLHELEGTRTGRVCVRCWDAEAKVYPKAQYPVPR